LPDLDPSIALAQAARQDFAREVLPYRLTAEQLIKRARMERAAYIAALLQRFAALLKSIFRASAGLTGAVRSDV
jgi:hypothetical protein